MCVHVFCADDLPNEALVWVDSRDPHIRVYADHRLTRNGALTPTGAQQVNRALAAVGAPSLETATPCR
ncbi:hypothetical protein ABZ958_03150 [Streptomyces sp. NPDC046237]|uniref:hypothetical protein n=1 Tax=Streptomyces sp. NPDC046237 TaxID=3154914 RepID=UPI0033D7E167